MEVCEMYPPSNHPPGSQFDVAELTPTDGRERAAVTATSCIDRAGAVLQVVRSGAFRAHRTDRERRTRDEERGRRAAMLLELWGSARRKMEGRGGAE